MVTIDGDTSNTLLEYMAERRIFDVTLCEGKRQVRFDDAVYFYFKLHLYKAEMAVLIQELQRLHDEMED